MTEEEIRQLILDVLTEVGGDITEVSDATDTELNNGTAITMPLYVNGNTPAYKKTTLTKVIEKATENIDQTAIQTAVNSALGISITKAEDITSL